MECFRLTLFYVLFPFRRGANYPESDPLLLANDDDEPANPHDLTRARSRTRTRTRTGSNPLHYPPPDTVLTRPAALVSRDRDRERERAHQRARSSTSLIHSNQTTPFTPAGQESPTALTGTGHPPPRRGSSKEERERMDSISRAYAGRMMTVRSSPTPTPSTATTDRHHHQNRHSLSYFSVLPYSPDPTGRPVTGTGTQTQPCPTPLPLTSPLIEHQQQGTRALPPAFGRSISEGGLHTLGAFTPLPVSTAVRDLGAAVGVQRGRRRARTVVDRLSPFLSTGGSVRHVAPGNRNDRATAGGVEEEERRGRSPGPNVIFASQRPPLPQYDSSPSLDLGERQPSQQEMFEFFTRGEHQANPVHVRGIVIGDDTPARPVGLGRRELAALALESYNFAAEVGRGRRLSAAIPPPGAAGGARSRTGTGTGRLASPFAPSRSPSIHSLALQQPRSGASSRAVSQPVSRHSLSRNVSGSTGACRDISPGATGGAGGRSRRVSLAEAIEALDAEARRQQENEALLERELERQAAAQRGAGGHMRRKQEPAAEAEGLREQYGTDAGPSQSAEQDFIKGTEHEPDRNRQPGARSQEEGHREGQDAEQEDTPVVIKQMGLRGLFDDPTNDAGTRGGRGRSRGRSRGASGGRRSRGVSMSGSGVTDGGASGSGSGAGAAGGGAMSGAGGAQRRGGSESRPGAGRGRAITH